MQSIDYLAMKLLLLTAALNTGGVEKVNTSLASDQLDSSACRSKGTHGDGGAHRHYNSLPAYQYLVVKTL